MDDGCRAIFEGLRENRSIRKLILTENNITDLGAKSICEYFYDNTKTNLIEN
jgi:hypothetical protein